MAAFAVYRVVTGLVLRGEASGTGAAALGGVGVAHMGREASGWGLAVALVFVVVIHLLIHTLGLLKQARDAIHALLHLAVLAAQCLHTAFKPTCVRQRSLPFSENIAGTSHDFKEIY